jgi:hypothetical protein
MTTRTSSPLKVKLGIEISRRDSDSNESLNSSDSTELAEWDYAQRKPERNSGGREGEQDEVVRKRRENRARRDRERDRESEVIWREFWG